MCCTEAEIYMPKNLVLEHDFVPSYRDSMQVEGEAQSIELAQIPGPFRYQWAAIPSIASQARIRRSSLSSSFSDLA